MHPKSLGRLERTDYWDPPAGFSDSVGVGEREGWDFAFLTYSRWCWCWSREHTLSSTETGHKIRFFKILINEENLFYISLTEHVPGTMLNAVHLFFHTGNLNPILRMRDQMSRIFIKDIQLNHVTKQRLEVRTVWLQSPGPEPLLIGTCYWEFPGS